MINRIKAIYHKLVVEEENIRHKVLNIILLCLTVATSLATIVTLFISHSVIAAVPVAMIFAITCFSLWLANTRNHYKLGGLILGITGNFFLFPIIYFLDGGMHTGMPLWILLGLIFNWMILEDAACVIMYILNIIVMFSCIYIESIHPEYVNYLSGKTEEAIDITLGLFLVSITLGLIYRYQSYAYEKQKEKIEERDRELTEAMIQVESANRAKSDFLANMSHEIRTPINAILGMNEMIERETDNDEIRTYSANIGKAGNALLSIINDLLDFSKIESGKMELVNVEYDLAGLAGEVYCSVATRAQAKHLSLQVRNNPDIPGRLIGDENRIRQVINNLLTNAVKYTSVGEVILKFDYVWETDNRIELIIYVSDTGMGIKEEDLDKIFANFQRVDEKTNRNIEGTGLGLSIVKNIVELMEGTVSVQSEYGAGSTFTIRIPQLVADEKRVGVISEIMNRKETASVEYKESFSAAGARVLSVDDVKMNQDVVTMLLKKTGVKIDTAFSGKECLEAIGRNKYDLILMDHFMPEMDGVETYREIRKMKDNPNISTPVVILTANAISGVEEKYMAEGFSGYLSKPIKGRDLEDMLHKLLPEYLMNENEKSEAAEKNKDERKGLAAFDFLDTEKALEYCAGSEEILLQSIDGFVGQDNFLEDLEKLYDNDWNEYRVKVHAVKTAAKMIGADELSEKAREIEGALREGDVSGAMEKHGDFIKDYSDVISRIEKILKNDGI